mmetsp:Transcript_59423/g.109960  ORF Transcript_59423/g.109960 Transcript_59423/m.109960 type:complete len:228 (+) Transcript_59423:108-791(+)
MSGLVNCCHAYLDTPPTRWICSTSAATASTHEEIVGADGRLYNSVADALAASPSSPSRSPGSTSNLDPARPEVEKESQKARLQRLIREFAHQVVGPGLPVEAESVALKSFAGANDAGHMEAFLRMDRRLSRIEIWPQQSKEGTPTEVAAVPLHMVSGIHKGSGTQEPMNPPNVDGSRSPRALLTISRQEGPELRLFFESPLSRDRAYTCLRIFQMSAGQPSSPRDDP